jgi:hypothetical protein
MNTRKNLIISICALVVIAGLTTLYLTKKDTTDQSSMVTLAAKSQNHFEAVAEQPGTKEFVLGISNNKISSGPKIITVNQNDGVVIHLNGAVPQDEADVLIDAYNLQATTAQNSGPALEFRATKKGQFPITIVPEDEEAEHAEQAGESVEEESHTPVVIGTLIVK